MQHHPNSNDACSCKCPTTVKFLCDNGQWVGGGGLKIRDLPPLIQSERLQKARINHSINHSPFPQGHCLLFMITQLSVVCLIGGGGLTSRVAIFLIANFERKISLRIIGQFSWFWHIRWQKVKWIMGLSCFSEVPLCNVCRWGMG